jgi:hypothetical protein
VTHRRLIVLPHRDRGDYLHESDALRPVITLNNLHVYFFCIFTIQPYQVTYIS